MNEDRLGHAVVIGASVAGILAGCRSTADLPRLSVLMAEA